MRQGWARVAAACILAASGALGSCASDPTEGYSFTSAQRSDVRTVCIPMFENTTFSHGIEARLTEALVKEIHRSTPWAVTGATAAETTLRGAITTVSLVKLGTQRESGLVQEYAVDIAVDFEWTDNRSGEPLVARQNFRGSGSFAPAPGASELLATGEDQAVQALARGIVAAMRSDW